MKNISLCIMSVCILYMHTNYAAAEDDANRAVPDCLSDQIEIKFPDDIQFPVNHRLLPGKRHYKVIMNKVIPTELMRFRGQTSKMEPSSSIVPFDIEKIKSFMTQLQREHGSY